jgi:hypothetical protein
MDELAVFEIPTALLPESLDQLQAALEGAGLQGTYRISDEMLQVVWGEDRLHFSIYPAYDLDGLSGGPGVEVAAELEDVAATLIDLMEIFEKAYPGSECSSELLDDEL